MIVVLSQSGEGNAGYEGDLMSERLNAVPKSNKFSEKWIIAALVMGNIPHRKALRGLVCPFRNASASAS